jgi:hypothetical protein
MLTIVELIGMTAAIVQIIKTYTDQNILKPNNPVHDNTIRLLSFVVGIALFAANQQGVALNSADILKLVYEGGLVGAGSIGTFHGVKAVAPLLAGSK